MGHKIVRGALIGLGVLALALGTLWFVTRSDEWAIRIHALRQLGLLPHQLDILELNPREHQSPVVRAIYYVEQRGTYGHGAYIYLFAGGQLYSSADEDNLERFMREQRILEQPDLDAEQLLTLFNQLTSGDPHAAPMVVRGPAELEGRELDPAALAQVTPPALERGPDGATLTFWTWMILDGPLDRWTLHIASDYAISVEREYVVGAQ